jgi:succinate-semialdehyde dehydrogenase/glutarate-semialdehyde dehydrogenase
MVTVPRSGSPIDGRTGGPRVDFAVPVQCFVGGKWTDAVGGSRFEVSDPATGELLAEVADADAADAEAAVDAADGAAAEWAQTAPRARSEILRQVFDLIIERAETLAVLIVKESGKALSDARGEVTYAAEFLRWYAEEAVRNAGELVSAPSGGGNRIMVAHQPVGISLLVTPWNFPAAMLTRKIAPALAAGCTVVCKPAEDTPLTALFLAGLFAEAGTPPGVVNVLPSSRPAPVVDALLGDPRLRKLSFTGSTEVGKRLLRAASARVVNCSMELGGNAPFIVFDDADLDDAVAGAMVAKMRNGGESCIAANRFYVQEGIADAFTKRLVDAMAAVTMGPGLRDGVTLGPLVNSQTREKVAGLVDGAREEGARVLVGGRVPSGAGCFYPATVLAEVSQDASILRQEIFGPVAPIVTFSREAEALEMANRTPHGLASYVFTGDLARGLRAAEALDSGMVGLNRGLISDPAAPFGGTKESGLGREGGSEGMGEYLETKYVACAW